MAEPLSRLWPDGTTKYDIVRPEQRGDEQGARTTARRISVGKNFRSADIESSPKALATRLSPPPAATQIWPTMDPLYGMS